MNTNPVPNNPPRSGTAFTRLVELPRPGEIAPGETPGIHCTCGNTLQALEEQLANQGLSSLRLLLVSPGVDGSSNVDNVIMDATTDSTSPCTCTKPTREQALSCEGTAPRSLKFVAYHSAAIARQVYLDHGYNSDEGRWTGVQVLHNSEGSFHAAWVGPFMENNHRYGQEWTVRTLLDERGLNQHARIFRATNFPKEEEAWDWTFGVNLRVNEILERRRTMTNAPNFPRDSTRL